MFYHYISIIYAHLLNKGDDDDDDDDDEFSLVGIES